MQRIFMYGIALLIGANAGSSVFAATIFFDDFTKPDSTAVSGSTPNIGGTYTTASGGTTNALTITGGAVPMTTSGQDVLSLFTLPAPQLAGNVVHTSLDINLSAAQATGDYFAHLGDGSTSSFYQRLFAQASGAGYVLGILETSGGANTPVYGTTVLPFGQTQHVDVVWNMIAGATNDQFDVSVNSAAYVSKTWSSPTGEPALVSSAHLRQGGGGAAATLNFVDNYQVDADTVVPEPAGFVLLSICGVLALIAQRNR
jgi:hypothetical protein